MNPLTLSYLALRRTVGLIGMLLPFVLLAGVHLLFPAEVGVKSISHYYHTGMGDVFVGALCAVAVFLYYYTGYDRGDRITANVAATLALGVAWFPASAAGYPAWTNIVHLSCAAGLFLALAYLSAFRFTRGEKSSPQKRTRNRIYKVCAWVIVVGIATVAGYESTLGKQAGGGPVPDLVFWAETAALVAFGTSWFVKGKTLFQD